MSDISHELRAIAQGYREPDSLGPTLIEAADELDRLQSALSEVQRARRKAEEIAAVFKDRDRLQAKVASLESELDETCESDGRHVALLVSERLQMRRLVTAAVHWWEERDRLRAIVDRLPKTADGVPITPGITIWDSIGVQPWEVTGVNTRLGSLSCIYGPDGSFDAICSGYYSTREAAEKARNHAVSEHQSPPRSDVGT